MSQRNGMNPKKIIVAVAGVVGLIVVLSVGSSIWSTVGQGYYQIKQALYIGTMSVHSQPGTYWLLGGEYQEYHQADKMRFCSSEPIKVRLKQDDGTFETIQEVDDSCRDPDYAPVRVRFRDGSAATISGYLQFKMPRVSVQQLQLHQDYKTYANVKNSLIFQTISDALIKTAALMKAEESYATKRAEFNTIAGDQLRLGIYSTTSKNERRQDADGNKFIETIVTIKEDEEGKKIIHRPSPFKQYDLKVIHFVVSRINYDDKIRELIDKKKEAEQQKVVARANAERAKQDAITAREKGKADVAIAHAKALVIKKTAVVAAQKKFEVAVFERKQANEQAKARLIRGQADAKANKLLVMAGLTPKERAEYKMNTAIGVAQQLAKVKFPGMMIIGGSNGGNALNPFDAVGLESFLKIQKRFSEGK